MSMTNQKTVKESPTSTVEASSEAVPPARALRRELFSDEMVDRLLDRVEADDLTLTGKGGFISEMLKSVLERGMQRELTDHLGYDAHDRAGHGSGNSRNGTSTTTVDTEVGPVSLDRPRDRNSTFSSKVVPKGERRMDGLDGMIISLYAGGMTIRDIQHHLARTLGTDLSHETISNVTEAVAEEVKAWQSRPLDAFYPVMYLDAIVRHEAPCVPSGGERPPPSGRRSDRAKLRAA